MQLVRRGTAVLIATLVATVGLVVVPPAAIVVPAGAVERPPVEIGPNDRLEIHNPQIVGNNAANQRIDPETCRLPVTTYCDAIHLKLNRPAGMGPDEEFTLRFQMSWNVAVEDVDSIVLGEVTSNDMDLFIWEYPYTPKREDGEDTEHVGSAATSGQPERTSFNTPPKDDYWLVIVNFVGVNEGGTKIKITWDPEVFPSPFEDLGDRLTPRDASAEESEITPSFTSPDGGLALSDAAPAFFTPPGGFSGIDAGVPTGTLTPLDLDGSFIDGVEGSLDQDLLAEAQRLTANPITKLRPARPVAGILVGFWLVAVPLALLVGAVLALLRRRPAALSF